MTATLKQHVLSIVARRTPSDLARLQTWTGNPVPSSGWEEIRDDQRFELEAMLGGRAAAAKTSESVFGVDHERISQVAAGWLIAYLKGDWRLDERYTLTLADPRVQQVVDRVMKRRDWEAILTDDEGPEHVTRDVVERTIWLAACRVLDDLLGQLGEHLDGYRFDVKHGTFDAAFYEARDAAEAGALWPERHATQTPANRQSAALVALELMCARLLMDNTHSESTRDVLRKMRAIAQGAQPAPVAAESEALS